MINGTQLGLELFDDLVSISWLGQQSSERHGSDLRITHIFLFRK